MDGPSPPIHRGADPFPRLIRSTQGAWVARIRWPGSKESGQFVVNLWAEPRRVCLADLQRGADVTSDTQRRGGHIRADALTITTFEAAGGSEDGTDSDVDGVRSGSGRTDRSDRSGHHLRNAWTPPDDALGVGGGLGLPALGDGSGGGCVRAGQGKLRRSRGPGPVPARQDRRRHPEGGAGIHAGRPPPAVRSDRGVRPRPDRRWPAGDRSSAGGPDGSALTCPHSGEEAIRCGDQAGSPSPAAGAGGGHRPGRRGACGTHGSSGSIGASERGTRRGAPGRGEPSGRGTRRGHRPA